MQSRGRAKPPGLPLGCSALACLSITLILQVEILAMFVIAPCVAQQHNQHHHADGIRRGKVFNTCTSCCITNHASSSWSSSTMEIPRFGKLVRTAPPPPCDNTNYVNSGGTPGRLLGLKPRSLQAQPARACQRSQASCERLCANRKECAHDPNQYFF